MEVLMRIKFEDGGAYEGDVLDNNRHGKGKCIYPDGAVYVGEWSHDQRHGQGKCTFKDGGIYEGNWVTNAMDGKGRLVDPDGTVYEGGFSDNKSHGKGKVFYTDGTTSEGDYLEGVLNGQVKLTSPHGLIYEGGMKWNKRSGKGRLVQPGGTVYEGGFSDNTYHGKGEFIFLDGLAVDVEHENGQLISRNDTKVIEFIENLLEEGPLINDDQDMLGEYVAFIHDGLDRKQKGANFGSAILAASYCHGWLFPGDTDSETLAKANMLSAEANNRMIAHCLYLKDFFSLDVREEAVNHSLIALLVDMACEVVETFSWDEENGLVGLGIRGVEYISENILD
jgi:hypothetical protein